MIAGVFNHHCSMTKHQTREILLQEVKELNIPSPVVLSLPADNFFFEEMLHQELPGADIHCVEYNTKLYLQTLSKAPDYVYYKRSDVFDYASLHTQAFDVMWIDLCSNLTHGILNRVYMLVQNHLKPNSLFALTVQAARDSIVSDFELLYPQYDKKHIRFQFIPKMITGFNKQLVYSKALYYSNGGCPMIVYIFKTQSYEQSLN
jgi:hypothetical protein